MASYRTETIETALTILAEWNAKSRAPVAIDKPDGVKLFREALRDAKALERLERTLQRRAEYRCNFQQTEAERAAHKRADDRTEAKALAIFRTWKLTGSMGGDCRGSMMRIDTPNSGRGNSFGDGWAI